MLLSVSLCVALCFLGFYIWSIKTHQFEDDYSPAHRIFFEDKDSQKNITKQQYED